LKTLRFLGIRFGQPSEARCLHPLAVV